jgi:hypothetical protein
VPSNGKTLQFILEEPDTPKVFWDARPAAAASGRTTASNLWAL